MKKWLFAFLFLCNYLVLAQEHKLKQIIKISDSLELNEKYIDAIDFWKKNQSVAPILSKKYITYFEYWNDFKNQSFDMIISVENSLLGIKNRNSFESELLIKIFSKHYQHIAENETWEKALEKALEGYNLKDFEHGNLKTKIDYLFDLGSIYREVKNPYEAIFFFNKSLDLNISANGIYNADVADSYNNLGDAYLECYNPTKSNECYKKAISILDKITTKNPEDIDKLLTSYRNFIRNLVEYGAVDEAKIYSDKTNILYFKSKNLIGNYSKELLYHSRQMQIHGNVLYYAASSNFEKAFTYCDSLKFETSLKKENIEAVGFVVNRYFDVVDFLYEKDYELTIKHAHELEPIINKFNLVVLKMLVNAKLGTSYEKVKKYDKALHHIKIAEQIVDQEHFNSSKFSIQIIKAMILSRMNNNQDAISIGKNTLEQLVYENTKLKITIDKIKFEDVSELADAYFINIFEKVADLYLKKFTSTKQKKDIEIAENLYTIAAKLFQKYYLKGEFNEYLNYYHIKITQGLLECMFLRNKSLDDRITILNYIEQNASQNLIKEFDKKLKRSNSKNAILIANLNSLKSELNFYNTNSEKKNDQKKIAELEKKIKTITQQITSTEKNFSRFNASNFNAKEIISNLTDEQQIIKYYVCDNAIYVVSFLENDIQIKKINQKENWENIVNSYIHNLKKINVKINNKENLFENLIPFEIKKSITIIPDGFLNYLPFEILLNIKTNNYLVENNLISYDYSLPMWLLHQKNKGKNYSNLVAFSPFYNATSKTSKRSDFKDLKYAIIESKSIVDLFGGTLFDKEKATKENFIKEKENFDIFHLSMHSQLFEEDFNKSCLVFTNQEKLYFSDLYGMHIPASLVVLSACDTGNGVLKTGEGIMSINRALTYAGVKSSVVSLWQVPDKETSEIMISFYENLKKGQSKDEALANAKKIFIAKNPMKNHPFYWAGFIVNGDVSPILKSYNWIVFAGLALLISLSFLVIFRKKLFYFRK
ncbi:MAG: CHAT domain-containing protein [Polaribacter sp.]|nr:CHAT domain-containing protein [Polaribacter sp.]